MNAATLRRFAPAALALVLTLAVLVVAYWPAVMFVLHLVMHAELLIADAIAAPVRWLLN